MSNPPVSLERRGTVVLVTLNRPERANALNRSMIQFLDSLVHDLASDTATNVVVIRGEGRNFCAGIDLEEALADGPIANGARFRFEDVPQPVIAAIHGAAMGGGLELALACDIRVAGKDSTLGLPEVQFGELPMLGGTVRLPRVVGVGVAKRMILTGESVNAEEALRIGLVDQLVAADDVLESAMSLADRIAKNPRFAVGAGKHLIDSSLEDSLGSALVREQREVTAMASEEERLQAREDAASRNPLYKKLFFPDR